MWSSAAAVEVIGTKGLDVIEYHQLFKISLLRRRIGNREEKKVDTSDKSQRHDVRIKIKIDQHGLPVWLSWSFRITDFKIYFLLSRACLKEIFLFFFYKR